MSATRNFLIGSFVLFASIGVVAWVKKNGKTEPKKVAPQVVEISVSSKIAEVKKEEKITLPSPMKQRKVLRDLQL